MAFQLYCGAVYFYSGPKGIINRSLGIGSALQRGWIPVPYQIDSHVALFIYARKESPCNMVYKQNGRAATDKAGIPRSMYGACATTGNRREIAIAVIQAGASAGWAGRLVEVMPGGWEAGCLRVYGVTATGLVNIDGEFKISA